VETHPGSFCYSFSTGGNWNGFEHDFTKFNFHYPRVIFMAIELSFIAVEAKREMLLLATDQHRRNTAFLKLIKSVFNQ